MKAFYVQMVEVLHVISGKFLQLKNEYSMWGGAFKFKAKNLAVRYVL
jgi:hypothetical protein